MPRTGTGSYVLPTPPSPFVNGTEIDATDMMTVLDDIATAISGSQALDGQATPTNDLSMDGHKLTNLGTATLDTDAVTLAQARGLGASFRNAMINPWWEFWQRGAPSTPSSTTAAVYVGDRWVLSPGAGNTCTYVRNSTVTNAPYGVANPRYSATIARTTTGANPTLFYQKIEGGQSFAGQSVTVTIRCALTAGSAPLTASFSQGFGTGGTPSASVFVAAQNFSPTASQAAYTLTFAIPSVSGKTLGTDGNDALWFIISLPAAAGNFTVEFTNIQVEAGTVATPAEKRPTGIELLLCQRYYQTGFFSFNGYQFTGGTFGSLAALPVTMRKTPTAVGTFTASTNATTPTVVGYGPAAVQVYCVATTPAPTYLVGTFTADAEL